MISYLQLTIIRNILSPVGEEAQWKGEREDTNERKKRLIKWRLLTRTLDSFAGINTSGQNLLFWGREDAIRCRSRYDEHVGYLRSVVKARIMELTTDYF